MKKRLGLLTSLLAICLAGSAVAGVITVPGDYAEIHDAVQACPPGDTVQVDPGTWTDCTHQIPPDTTFACVIMKSGVTLIGSGVDETIIDVQGLGRGIWCEGNTDFRIENLQVRNAFADVYGAAILVRECTAPVELSDLIIDTNTDGGIIVITNAEALVQRVDFLNNLAKQGGGLAIEEGSTAEVYDCYFNNNGSPSGGGMLVSASAVTMDNCVFEQNFINFSFGNGGGLAVFEADPVITNCQFLNNTTEGYGGGVAFMNGSGGSLSHSLIKGNQADFQFSLGGGIHTDGSSPLLEYLTIVENDAGGEFADGGGINVNFGPAPTIRNCTIASNTVGGGGTAGGISFQFGGDAVVDKCIIADNGALGLSCIGSNPTISCSDVFGNGGDALCGTDGGNNFSLDPDFCGIDDPNFPWGITDDSPCTPSSSPCGELVGAGPQGCGTGVAEGVPGAARLLGNVPNPFNPNTSIFFVLDHAGDASIRIFDVAGRTVARIPLGTLGAGQHEVSWNGRTLDGQAAASGVYLYELNALGETHSRRMTLLK